MSINGRRIALMGTVLLTADIAISAQVSSSIGRHVQFRPRVALEQIVRPGEKMLIVDSTASPPLEVLGRPGATTAEWKTEHADVVVVVDVLSIEGRLAAAKDWVTSHVTASVLDIAKARQGWRPKIGAVITFDQQGGETYISGTRVVASVSWAGSLEVGKRYLMFANLNHEANELSVFPSGIYEMTGSDTFRRPAQSQSGLDGIEETAQAEVLRQVRSAVK